MKQYEPCIQNDDNNNNNNNNNNNIIIIIKWKKINQKGAKRASGGESVREREYYFYFFLLFVSFSDLRKSDGKFLSGLKTKLIYTTRATRGHQNLGVSSNSTR